MCAVVWNAYVENVLKDTVQSVKILSKFRNVYCYLCDEMLYSMVQLLYARLSYSYIRSRGLPCVVFVSLFSSSGTD
jgi:hypothetical protein